MFSDSAVTEWRYCRCSVGILTARRVLAPGRPGHPWTSGRRSCGVSAQPGSAAWVELAVRGFVCAGVWICGGLPLKLTRTSDAGAMRMCHSFEPRDLRLPGKGGAGNACGEVREGGGTAPRHWKTAPAAAAGKEITVPALVRCVSAGSALRASVILGGSGQWSCCCQGAANPSHRSREVYLDPEMRARVWEEP